jgi:hypothetical protein
MGAKLHFFFLVFGLFRFIAAWVRFFTQSVSADAALQAVA